ncbi:hypothetical protein J4442_02435 [Candidatus Woesearchaeota archaeon]|nr:hypothetical protein [Candidatus Woesearchaeota archaeon]
MKINEEYDELRKKYKLPSFDEVNYEFEISTLDVNKIPSLSRGILRAICNKMGLFLNYVEPVISPNPQGLHGYIEIQNTTNDEKKEIFEFYKDLSKKYHKAYSTELTEKEEEIIKEIKNVLKYWDSVRVRFKKISEVINKAWEKELEKEKIETIG